MSTSRILARFIMILGCAVAGAVAGTLLQTVLAERRIVDKPQEFRSQAKLVAGGQMALNDSLNWKEQQQDFYGTIIETVDSEEMSRRARERIRALNPDMQESDVAIRVAQTKGSAIFTILATGSDPKYTRVFLDALLDEFIAFRQNIREQAQGKVLQTFLQEVVSKQKSMEDSLEKFVKARGQGSDTLSVRSDLERLVPRLNSQRNQRDDLRLKIKSMKDDDAARASSQTELEAIESEIQTIEKNLDRRELALAELKTLQGKAETDKRAYDKLFEQVERIESVFNSASDYVAIQERATPSFEIIEEWKQPVAFGAGGGALLGGLIGFVLSLLLIRSPKPPQIPTPVG